MLYSPVLDVREDAHLALEVTVAHAVGHVPAMLQARDVPARLVAMGRR